MFSQLALWLPALHETRRARATDKSADYARVLRWAVDVDPLSI